MTREEAIEVIKAKADYLESDKRFRAAVETIIPELRESEDERIRKKMIEHFKSKTKDTWCNMPVKSILAWLEKQKENPKSADSIPSDCTSDAKYEDRWHKVTDSLPDNGRLVLAKDCLGNVLLARYDGENWEVNVYDNEDHYCHNSISKWCEIPSEKQKGQKPAEWSEEDKRKLNRIYGILGQAADERPFGSSKRIIGDKEAVELQNFIRSIRPQQIVEWSEEDEIMLKWIEDILLIADGDLSDKLNGRVSPITDSAYSSMKLCIAKCRSWLKSLPLNLKKKNEDVAKLCSKEWSVEDEKLFWGLTAYVPNEELERLGVTRNDILKKLKSIRHQPIQIKEAYKEGFQTARHATALAFMNYCDKIRPNGKMCLSNGECEEIRKHFLVGDWEKIERYLRKYSWKPSEEQMKAMSYFVRKHQATANRATTKWPEFEAFKSLYNDLKKLM